MDGVIQSLCFCLSLLGHSCDPITLSRLLQPIKHLNIEKQCLLLAKGVGFKCRTLSPNMLNNGAFPLIVGLEQHGACVVVRADRDICFIFKASMPDTPLLLSLEELKELMIGRAVRLEKDHSGAHSLRTAVKHFFDPGTVLLIAGATLLIQTLGFTLPLFSQIIIDRVLIHQNLSALHVFGVLGVVLATCELVLSLSRVYLSTEASAKLDLLIATRINRSILSKPLAFYFSTKVGELIELSRRADIFKRLNLSGGIFNALDLIFAGVFIVLMAAYSLPLTLLSGAFLTVIVLLNGALDRYKQREPTLESAAPAILTEALQGIETVKLSAREGWVLDKICAALVIDASVGSRDARHANWTVATNIWVQRIGILSTLWYGALLVLDHRLSMGQLVAYQMFSSRVFHPIARATHTLQELRKAFSSFRQIEEKVADFSAEKTLCLSGISSLSTSNLTFRYGPGSPLLAHGLNLDILKGQKIAIMGNSGCGKSTLLRLLTNVFQAQMGRVMVNGVDIRQFNQTLIRNKVCLVPQQAFLFSGTILQNVAPFEIAPDREALDSLARLVCAEDIIHQHPDHYERHISEAGNSLSGGQRQRLCLLRALASKPEILLLDESTSALDEHTENTIHSNLIKHFPQLTIITVSHRPQSLKHYDRVLRLENGKLVPQETDVSRGEAYELPQ